MVLLKQQVGVAFFLLLHVEFIRTLNRMVRFAQRAAGHWEPCAELWAILGKDEHQVLSTKPDNLSVDAWVTLVVINFLRVRHNLSWFFLR